MARGLTPSEVRAALSKWKVPTRFRSGWATRSNGNAWKDVTGAMFHHTADDSPDATTVNLLTYGHSSLRGPLANFGAADDGILDVIAAGPANCAGGGDPDVLRAVRLESYGLYPPAPNEHQGSAGSVGGNSLFYNWEAYYAGPKDPTINPQQYRVTILSMAAIIDALDSVDGPSTTWTSKSMIGHKEWSDWKVDPKGVDMKDARADLQWCLDNGPDAARAWYDTGKKTAAAGKDELDMASEAEVKAWVREVLQEKATAQAIWTKHPIMRDPFALDPDTSGRVTPSRVCEAAAGVVPDGIVWSGSENPPPQKPGEGLDLDALANAIAPRVAHQVLALNAEAIADIILQRLQQQG